ncbi:MAG TPA: hypothetical protein VG817_07035, partial [Gemmatimonadales bacterium]|nr:hypothetical protein [Gemmatimonadales bacterium]
MNLSASLPAVHAAGRRSRRPLFLSLGFMAACLPWLVACGNPDAEADGARHGELHIYRVSYPDGHSEREFYLAKDEHTPATTRLIFVSDPGFEPWTRVKVWGLDEKDGVRVTRVERENPQADEEAEALAASEQPLIGVAKKTRTVGFVMMDVGNGVNITADAAQTAVFGTRTPTSAGLNQFYTEVSYGGLSFTGEILGPASITTLGTCQQSAITQIENGWASHFGKTFNHWMTYIGSNFQSCGWSGIGGEGTAQRPASGSWYNASTGCTVLNQEVGHNLGMMHSGSMSCSGQSFLDDPLGCSGSEYGDRSTVMGSGCQHLIAYEKWYEGFFAGCNGVRVNGSGTYTLLPTEIPCNGVQTLQIPMPKSRPFRNTQGTTTQVTLSKYYLELRTKTGIDGNVSAPNVLVTVGADVMQASKTSQFTWVLDMNPSTSGSYDGMSKGQTFNDPAGGLSFTVQELDASHASINVTMTGGTGASTCIDNTTFTAPGPASCEGGTSGGGTSSTGGVTSTGGSGGSAGKGGSGGSSGGGGGGGGGGKAGTGGANSGGNSGGSATGGKGGGGAGGTPSTGGMPGTGGRAGGGGSGGSGNTGGAGKSNAGGNSGSGGANTAGASGSGGSSG